MSVAGIAASASHQASSAQALQTPALHNRSSHRAKSISDVDAQSSSLAKSAGASTGRVGSRLDVTA